MGFIPPASPGRCDKEQEDHLAKTSIIGGVLALAIALLFPVLIWLI